MGRMLETWNSEHTVVPTNSILALGKSLDKEEMNGDSEQSNNFTAVSPGQ
jgi:hypothetical protein